MNFLELILKEKKEFVKRRKRELSQDKLIKRIKSPLEESRFKNILRKPGLHLITEIKRASPSKGDLRPDLDIIDIACIYQQQGIELVSVLTEREFFKGDIKDIEKVTQNTDLSVLCKDFVIDIYQIFEAKVYGAEAVLLIAKILSKKELRDFFEAAKSIKMDVLVEVHNEEDLDKAVETNPNIDIIGINHRNLESFSVKLEMTERLLPTIPKDKIVISESGIESAENIRYFKELGVSGVLIGESLMRESDIRKKLGEFVDAAK